MFEHKGGTLFKIKLNPTSGHAVSQAQSCHAVLKPPRCSYEHSWCSDDSNCHLQWTCGAPAHSACLFYVWHDLDRLTPVNVDHVVIVGTGSSPATHKHFYFLLLRALHAIDIWYRNGRCIDYLKKWTWLNSSHLKPFTVKVSRQSYFILRADMFCSNRSTQTMHGSCDGERMWLGLFYRSLCKERCGQDRELW